MDTIDRAFDTNSMFVLDEKQTMKFINDVASKTIKDFPLQISK